MIPRVYSALAVLGEIMLVIMFVVVNRTSASEN